MLDEKERAKRREEGRRVRAARILRGIKRRELGELMEMDGLGVQDPIRLESGALQLQRKHIDSLSAHLHVPPDWFRDPDSVLLWPKERVIEGFETRNNHSRGEP